MTLKYTLIMLLLSLSVFALTPLSGEAVEVSVPHLVAKRGASVVIPVDMSQITGLRSMGLTVAFDPAILTIDTVKKGEFVSNFLLAHNVVSPGTLKIALASAREVKGVGPVVFIHATVKADAPTGQISPLRLAEVRINGGEIPAIPKDGEVIVDGEVAVARRALRLTLWGRMKRGL